MIILVMVASIDGKTTKWDSNNIYEWTSPEDSQYFFSVIGQNSLIVMGRKTYEARNPKPQEGKLRVVVTRSPKKYNKLSVAGQLEFTNKSPKQLVEHLIGRGFKQVILLGGAALAKAFLEEKLIDQLWLTIEPRIFGSGNSLTSESQLDIRLNILNIEKLNKKGTLFIKYRVTKTS